MGNKPSNAPSGGPTVDSRRTTTKKRATLGVKASVGAPVVPLGPKNYVDMGFPEEEPSSGIRDGTCLRVVVERPLGITNR